MKSAEQCRTEPLSKDVGTAILELLLPLMPGNCAVVTVSLPVDPDGYRVTWESSPWKSLEEGHTGHGRRSVKPVVIECPCDHCKAAR